PRRRRRGRLPGPPALGDVDAPRLGAGAAGSPSPVRGPLVPPARAPRRSHTSARRAGPWPCPPRRRSLEGALAELRWVVVGRRTGGRTSPPPPTPGRTVAPRRDTRRPHTRGRTRRPARRPVPP